MLCPPHILLLCLLTIVVAVLACAALFGLAYCFHLTALHKALTSYDPRH